MYILYSKVPKGINKTLIKISDCIFTKAEFEIFCEGDYKKLFPQYKEEDHIVHEGEALKFPVITPDGLVREMTHAELALNGDRNLIDGEKIADGVLTFISKPSDLHKFINGEWVYQINDVIDDKIKEVDSIKSKLLSNGYRWNTSYIQRCRPEKDIPLIRETIESFKSVPNYTIKWYFTNQIEGYLFTTIDEFEDMRSNGMVFLKKIFDVESELKIAITNCTTQQEIESIDVELIFNNAIREYL